MVLATVIMIVNYVRRTLIVQANSLLIKNLASSHTNIRPGCKGFAMEKNALADFCCSLIDEKVFDNIDTRSSRRKSRLTTLLFLMPSTSTSPSLSLSGDSLLGKLPCRRRVIREEAMPVPGIQIFVFKILFII